MERVLYNAGMIPGVDEVILSKRKRITLTVQPGGKVILRAPLRTPERTLKGFAHQNAEWIRLAKAKMQKVPAPTPAPSFKDGEKLWMGGEQYPLHVVPKVPGGFKWVPGQYFLVEEGRQAQAGALYKLLLRDEARRQCEAIAARYAQKHGLKPGKIRINSARTRWGSCSANGGLNFSLRLAMTPPECVEYVVVHELAHLAHHNHSPRFWTLVGEMLPDFARRRDWLKKNGRYLPPI